MTLEKIIEHLDYLSTEQFGSLREAHEHRIEDAGWLYVTAKSLSAEVKRLKKVIDIMSCRMDSYDECLSLHEERVCGGIEGGCFLCEEIKTLQRGPYVWGENSPKSEVFYLEDGVWKEQEGEEE